MEMKRSKKVKFLMEFLEEEYDKAESEEKAEYIEALLRLLNQIEQAIKKCPFEPQYIQIDIDQI